MNPQEQRIADALVERIRQRRDTIDPELAQRIHGGLRDAPDAFYLLAQAAVAQGVQLESLQAQMQQQQPVGQPSWHGQPPPPAPPQQPGFLESIFGSGQPAPPAQNYYGQAQGYGGPTQQPLPPAQPQPQTQPPYAPTGGQPLGTSGYQAVNANLPGANANPAPQYPSGYGAPYGQPQPYPQQGYGGSPAYGTQAYPAQGYGAPGAPSGYPAQTGYPQAGYGAPQNVPAAGYMPAPGYPPASGYPSPGGWAQPGGSMLGGVGGVVAGVAAGALVTGAVESVVHSYENHERREEEIAREEHSDHGGNWRFDHERGLADTTDRNDDSSFYTPGHDASSDDDKASNFADTGDDDSRNSGDDDNSNDDASDFGGFSGDDNS